MKHRILLTGCILIAMNLQAAGSELDVQVTMNATSKTMTLAPVDGGESVETGSPSSSNVYSFTVPEGEYLLTAFATDGSTVNGTIVLDVTPGNTDFKVLTCTAYATNSGWMAGDDYTVSVNVNSREGVVRQHSMGQSTSANRPTFLAFVGDSYNATFMPSQLRIEEGYGPLYKGGTLTSNTTVSGAIAKAGDFTVTIPADAKFQMGLKLVHFADFTDVEPVDQTVEGDNKVLHYKLTNGQVYNYRTWKDGGVTMAAYFTMQDDETKRPTLNFSPDDYNQYNPRQVNHDVSFNNGYETGDILLNINERGFMNMTVGQTFKSHAMRMWELTDNSTNNYFFEPDFHYTVLNLDGQPDNNVLEIVQKPGSAWADITAKAAGEVIVLVTYDAIKTNYFSNNGTTANPYMGGEFWSAVWPENTGVFVVKVGGEASTTTAEFTVNEKYNEETKKMAGKYVDAEHDVFYYLEEEAGFPFTFTASAGARITLAYPEIGENAATYKGFGTEGVTDNGDGSFTVLLKEGRQIVKVEDSAGNATYQVLTAKTCRREITNATRPGSKVFQPGDQVAIQYTGLRHPANKIAGIYNMSAYVTYNGKPNGTSLIQGSGQYTFGSASSAQLVKVDIPDNYDADAEPVMTLSDGVIQVNGFGDPIGNHRTISPVAGRSPNFNAVSHQTYFGAIPDVEIKVSPKHLFDISVQTSVEADDILLTFNGEKLVPGPDGHYTGTWGNYKLTVGKKGYRCAHKEFSLNEGDADTQVFAVEMVPCENGWDGKTLTAAEVNANGQYVISSAENLAWFASQVNNGASEQNAILVSDIDLADYEWTPIGNKSKYFKGEFTGCGHSIEGLYIDGTSDYAALFGYSRNTSSQNSVITGITADGFVSGNQYAAGVLAYAYSYTMVDTCANYASVCISATGTSGAGGIVGFVNAATCGVNNSYNAGSVSGAGYHGGIIGRVPSNFTNVKNVFNIGDIENNENANACFGYAKAAMAPIPTAFAVENCDNTYGYTQATQQQMESGEIAFKLGDAFGQKIGKDLYPVFNGTQVLHDEDNDLYYNKDDENDDPTTGIIDVTENTEATVEAYFNLQGVKASTPWKGVNIVKFTDGTVKKVLVK